MQMEDEKAGVPRDSEMGEDSTRNREDVMNGNFTSAGKEPLRFIPHNQVDQNDGDDGEGKRTASGKFKLPSTAELFNAIQESAATTA